MASSEQRPCRPHPIFFPPQLNTFSPSHLWAEVPTAAPSLLPSCPNSLENLPSPTPWAAYEGVELHVTGLLGREEAALRRIWAEGGVAFSEDLVRSEAVKEPT